MSEQPSARPSGASDTISQVILGRRTVHEFRPEEPPRSLLLAAIEHARWAPNHYRTEPWRFYLLSRARGMEIAALNAAIVRAKSGEAAADAKLKRWQAMPGWLVVTCCRDPDEQRQREDYAACCCAVQNLMLYLWPAGVGVKWSTGKVIRDPGFFAAIGADPDREFVVGLFWCGYPLTVPDQSRKPLAQIVHEIG